MRTAELEFCQCSFYPWAQTSRVHPPGRSGSRERGESISVMSYADLGMGEQTEEHTENKYHFWSMAMTRGEERKREREGGGGGGG